MTHNPKETPIIFFGTPDFAAIQLENLLKEAYHVAAVVTAPDKPAGRGLQLRPSAVKQLALRHNIPILQPVSLKDKAFLTQLRSFNAKIFIVIAFRMLPQEVWGIPSLGAFNLHASLLPDYRGAAPINWAIINGETETGLTTFFLNENIDEGNIILQQKLPIHENDTAGDLHDRMAAEAWPLLKETIRQIVAGEASALPQDHAQSIHKAPKLVRENLRINWLLSVDQIRNHIRGLSPRPGAFTEIRHTSGKIDEMRILRASKAESVLDSAAPYQLFVWNKQLLVNHPEGMLRLDEVQLKGKKTLTASEFIKGFRDDGGWKVC